MISKIKQYAFAALAAAALLAPVYAPATVLAANCDSGISSSLAKGANGAAGSSEQGCASSGVGEENLTSIANKIVNLFSLLVGAVAVIMIIVGGFRYITSGGDSNKVGGAKNTLIYAIVGLIIVALAQIIVKFVLNQSTNAAGA